MRKPTTLPGLINALNSGCNLIQTNRNTDCDAFCVSWSLHPQGITVETRLVDRLMEVGALSQIGDGLFDGFSQQWEWVPGKQTEFSKRTLNKLLPELQPKEAELAS